MEDTVSIQIKQKQDNGTWRSRTVTAKNLGDYETIYNQIQYLINQMTYNKSMESVTLTHMIPK